MRYYVKVIRILVIISFIFSGCKKRKKDVKTLIEQMIESQSGAYEIPSYFVSIKGYAIVEKNNRLYVVVDNKEYGPYDKVSDFIRYWRSYKVLWSFAVAKKDTNYIIMNGKIFGPYETIAVADVCEYREYYCPRPVFVGTKNDKFYLIINATELGPFDAIGSPLYLSKSLSKWQIWVLENGKYYFLMNEKEKWGPYDNYRYLDIFLGDSIQKVEKFVDIKWKYIIKK